MPRMDGTGPQGRGPRTGRGLGSCGTGNDQQQQSAGWLGTILSVLGALGVQIGSSGPGAGKATGRGAGRGQGRGKTP